MEKTALHLRISGVTVSDDDVTSRNAAIASLASRWGKEKAVSGTLSKAAEVAQALGEDGRPSQKLGEEVQAAIQKKSASYLYSERPLDVGVCAGLAMVSMLTGASGGQGWAVPDVCAVALWSALGFQPRLDSERREALRQDVLTAAQSWAVVVAERARRRSEVPDAAEVTVTVGENNATTNDFPEAIRATVAALRRNAALDREELDFLWWAQLGQSRLLKRSLSSIPEPLRIIAAGIEGAAMLRWLPCDVHRELVLRTVDKNPTLDLSELIAAVGDDRAAIGQSYQEGMVATFPGIFPLLSALATGNVAGAGAGVKRPITEWGERALLEAGFAKLTSQNSIKL